MRAFVVLDLGFGDSGKGLLVDHLVRREGATVVVRYNGGAQAGHNVVAPDGRHHTFAQFGAGTFVPGVRTFLSRHLVVSPTALQIEAAALDGKGVHDALARVAVSEGARVVTPFHQAVGRLRELARGAARHGSCGAGIGETVRDGLAHPGDEVVAGDLRDPAALRRKLARLRERLAAEAAALAALAGAGEAGASAAAAAARELEIFAERSVAELWLAAALPVAERVVADATLGRWLAAAPAAVFEGAQGVLLDEWHGFHPYTTWSTCTAANALEILGEAAPGAAVERVGVMRCHLVRHGPGPLPTESEAPRQAVREHNRAGFWQGGVRYGWFDAVLARYALEAAGPLERLAVTHLDVPARLGRWQVAAAYGAPPGAAGGGDLVAEWDGAGRVRRLAVASGRDLARQERLTAFLGVAAPAYVECEPSARAVVADIERQIGRRVDLLASGPGAADVACAAAPPAA